MNTAVNIYSYTNYWYMIYTAYMLYIIHTSDFLSRKENNNITDRPTHSFYLSFFDVIIKKKKLVSIF